MQSQKTKPRVTGKHGEGPKCNIQKPLGLKCKAKKETKPPVKQKKDHFANKGNQWTETQSQKKPHRHRNTKRGTFVQ